MKRRIDYIKESVQNILMELSPQTLASYVTKATTDLGRHENLAGRARVREREFRNFADTGVANSGDPITPARRKENRDQAMGEHKRSEFHLKKALDRFAGIGRVTTRLMNSDKTEPGSLAHHMDTDPNAKKDWADARKNVVALQQDDASRGTHWHTDFGNLRQGFRPYVPDGPVKPIGQAR